MRPRDVLFTCAAASFITAPVHALDFSAALQSLDAGTPVEHVELDNGASMHVAVENGGGGPDLVIVFDSANPSGGDVDLGTPHRDFGGPGVGSGGRAGARGENKRALGHVLVIAGNDEDEDGDGLIDDPEDESGGGIVWLTFSHAGHLRLTLVDVDEDEDEPRIVLYRHGERVGEVEGRTTGDNGAQTLRLSETADKVAVHLDGSASIGAIELDVPVVGVEPRTWTGVKRDFR